MQGMDGVECRECVVRTGKGVMNLALEWCEVTVHCVVRNVLRSSFNYVQYCIEKCEDLLFIRVYSRE